MKRTFLSISFAFLFTLSSVLGAALAIHPQKAEALSGSQFNASRIIDDSVFFNGGTMSWERIQEFLNSKVPTCDTNGTLPSGHGSYTRAQWGQMNGNPAPYTCLKDYFQGVPAKSPDAYCGGSIQAGTKNAAQIIYDVGAACNVNPQALIVLLQKEQSLVTDDWPWPVQYRSATGYGCPDTAPCDAEYYGFFNQLYNAARQLQRYTKLPQNFNYAAGRTSFISYQANNPGCSGTNLTLQNGATAALYNYTPYQPNQAALNNLYGTGDSCSAYGNRNFWRMFNDWFGSTTGEPAQYYGQGGYPNLWPGEAASTFIKYRNGSNSIWFDDTKAAANNSQPVHLAVTNPINSQSPFSWGWPSKARPAVIFGAVYKEDGVTLADDQHAARPGQIIQFNFNITVPYGYSGGKYTTYFQPVLEGAGNWNLGGTSWVDVYVKSKTYIAQYAGQNNNPTLKPGEAANLWFRYKNMGNVNWYDDVHAAGNGELPIHLATSRSINRESMFSWGWPGRNRPAVVFAAVYEANGTTLAGNQHVAEPGQIVQFNYTATTPWDARAAQYEEHFQPVHESSPDWNMGGEVWSTINVPQITYSAQYAGQSGYPTLSPGQAAASYLQYKNTGNMNWYDTSTAAANNTNPVRLATTNPINAASSFSWGWPSTNRASSTFSAVYEADGTTLASDQHVVLPGQIARFNFNLTVPYGWSPGNNTVYFQPVFEGDRWNMGGVAWFNIKVQ